MTGPGPMIEAGGLMAAAAPPPPSVKPAKSAEVCPWLCGALTPDPRAARPRLTGIRVLATPVVAWFAGAAALAAFVSRPA